MKTARYDELGGGMFGSDADKKDKTTTSPTGTASIVTDDKSGGEAAAPNTTIAPAAAPQQTAPYLEAPGQDNNLPGSNSFLAAGSGAPKISTSSDSAPTPLAMPPEGADDLAKIKQQALQSLSPLIDKLDQSPEERFKTLMMLIQASDNPQYLDEAYEAANGIKDEKTKAQALLDVVNEINYFTQNQAPAKKA